MGRRSGWICAVLSLLLLTACGGMPAAGPASSAAPGFVNSTQHTDSQLWSLWTTAQQNLSQQIDLNPLQQQLNGAPPHILPGDPRALNVSPPHLTVASQPDVASATLLAATGLIRPNPTGLIACPSPCNVQYAPAYSLYAQPTTRYALSWENSGNNFDTLVEYEFENQILHTLGYDMTWR